MVRALVPVVVARHGLPVPSLALPVRFRQVVGRPDAPTAITPGEDADAPGALDGLVTKAVPVTACCVG